MAKDANTTVCLITIRVVDLNVETKAAPRRNEENRTLEKVAARLFATESVDFDLTVGG